MDKNEVILKFYRFLSLSIMTTDRKGRTIGIAVKAKAEGKKKKMGATVQKCMGGGATKTAKTFQLVLKTLNQKKKLKAPLGIWIQSGIDRSVD